MSSEICSWAWLAVVPLHALPSPYTTSPTSSDSLEDRERHTTDSNTDLYVIHAMVYEVGILTNSSDSGETSTDKGEQVAVTFFHKNGSDIDFSRIPPPLYTNVTGRAMTGVGAAQPWPPAALGADEAGAPHRPHRRRRDEAEGVKTELPTDALEHMSSCSDDSEYPGENEEEGVGNDSSISESISGEDSDTWKMLFKRDVDAEIKTNAEGYWHVKSEPTSEHVVKVPPQTSVQSIGLPPLLSLNANLSDIPVPFPNTSIIRYSTLSSHIAAVNNSQTA